MSGTEELVALDVETTGLDPCAGHRIVEIALLRISCGTVVEKFVTLVNPEREIPPEVCCINGITEEMVRNAPFFRDIAQRVCDFISGKTLLIHNKDFDISFLRQELRICGTDFPPVQHCIDTLAMARAKGVFKRNSLSYLVSHYRLNTGHLHRAEADALAAYGIYRMMNREERKEACEK